MNLTMTEIRKKLKSKTVSFLHGDIQFFKRKKKTIWIDNRTEHGLLPEKTVVYPFFSDDVQVHIICPFCGEIHVHGKVEGYRSSHCKGRLNPDYYIKLNRGD